MPLVRMKAAPVETDGERLGAEITNDFFPFTYARTWTTMDPEQINAVTVPARKYGY